MVCVAFAPGAFGWLHHVDSGRVAPGLSAEVGTRPCNRVIRGVLGVVLQAAAAPTGKYVCNGKVVEIRDVWAENLEAEMKVIREVIVRYPYVAMVS